MTRSKMIDPIARLNSAISLSPIFQPLKRGVPREHGVDKSYVHGGITYHFISRDLLGAGDQSVLLALISIGQSPEFKNITQAPHSAEGEKLRALLEESPSREGKCRKIQTTLSEIARIIGHQCGGNTLASIKASLHRLSNVILIINQNGSLKQAKLISFFTNEQNEKIWICLSTPLASALRGESQYNTISLSEHTMLKSEGAKILHAWVSSVMGKRINTFRINLGKLEKRVWPDAAKSSAAQRKRLERIRNFLKDFENLPEWQVSITTKGIVAFVRPNGHKSTSVQSQPSSKQSHAISVKHCIPRIHTSKKQKDKLI